jgi:hypothetical protein
VQLRYDKNSTMRFDKCAYSNLDNSNLELKTGSYLSFPLAVYNKLNLKISITHLLL